MSLIISSLSLSLSLCLSHMGFPGGSVVKYPPAMQEMQQEKRVWSLGQGRPPGEGNSNPLQYPCLGNPLDKGAWWATVHWVTKSWTYLNNSTTAFSHIQPTTTITITYIHNCLFFILRISYLGLHHSSVLTWVKRTHAIFYGHIHLFYKFSFSLEFILVAHLLVCLLLFLCTHC